MDPGLIQAVSKSKTQKGDSVEGTRIPALLCPAVWAQISEGWFIGWIKKWVVEKATYPSPTGFRAVNSKTSLACMLGSPSDHPRLRFFRQHSGKTPSPAGYGSEICLFNNDRPLADAPAAAAEDR